jgi:hypothetical protein
MKNHVKGILCLTTLFFCIVTHAQKKPPVHEPEMNRPAQFSNLPDRIICHINDLESLLKFETGRNVTLPISENLIFRGIVTSVASREDNTPMQSVVIRSTNFPGSVLSFSKISVADGSVRYSGRIISFQHADAYEINLENNQYVFVKKGFYDLVNE